MEQEVAKTEGGLPAEPQREIARPKPRLKLAKPQRKAARPRPQPKLGKSDSQGELASPEERRAAGRALRDKVPRESHAEWKESGRRPDPIDILIASNRGRMPQLVPIRHSRMLTSPFAFLRGSAAVMAADLSRTPVSGLRVQACGDCHLMNFGAFATPERQMVMDINDCDETLPAPWEWDLKRLAASIVVAGRYVDFKERDALAAATGAVRSYRRWMARYADMRTLEVWYDHIDIKEVMAEYARSAPAAVKRFRARIAKERARSVVEHDFPKLTESNGGRPRIKDNAPLIFHPPESELKEVRASVAAALKLYRESLADHYRALFDRFRFYDLAVKVVGVGSVGTFCLVALFMASDSDPLFLQVKQANSSVLEPYAGKSAYANHGQRVVMGQRLMQAASDMMLGWTFGKFGGRDFYIRQLRDMKLSAVIEGSEPAMLKAYGKLCGRILARAHARSGDAAMISGYLGNSGVFDEAVTKFAGAYADQTERDHKALRKAVGDGRLEAATE